MFGNKSQMLTVSAQKNVAQEVTKNQSTHEILHKLYLLSVT